MPDPIMSPKKFGVGAIVFGFIWLLLVISIFSGGSNPSKSKGGADYVSSASPTEERVETPRANAFSSATGAGLDGQEKQLYEQDPASMGYTEGDREFLKQQGVSEAEARAAETVLQQHGVE